MSHMLPPDVFYLNRQHQQPRVTVESFMSRFKFEDSDLGDVDEIEEGEEEFENELSESILDHSFDEVEEETMEEEEEEFEEIANEVFEPNLVNSFDEEIMEEEEEEFEEISNDVSESILDEEIIEEEEEFEVDISENMETTMDEVSESVETGMEYDIHLLNQQQGPNQTSGRWSRTARMRVNTNYTRYTVQVPQLTLDEIEDEEEEEEVVEEDDINEFMDQDMSQYFETTTYCAHPTMDTDGDDDDEEQEACAICLLEYQDEHTIATLQCGHEFHAECINEWLQRKRSCPFCRASVLPTNT